MTRWIITLISNSPDDDSKILELMKRAAKSGLKYSVGSKEIPDSVPVEGITRAYYEVKPTIKESTFAPIRTIPTING